jgi:DNA recombination protein RmuC
MILERLLETAGLTSGIHYEPRSNFAKEGGARAQPDVVVRLPQERHLVIDAKVSLTAYDDYVRAGTDPDRQAAIQRHLASVQAHVNGLSSKNYQELHQLNSLDFVIMFVPVEPAFALALGHGRDLWHRAWEKNILLVSPSTLLFVVRTVAQLWRQEQQTRNVQEIAKRGAELYDKLVGLVNDMDDIGKCLERAQTAYTNAYSKFKTGKGNLIRQAELLKGLGVNPTKSLPKPLLDDALSQEDSCPSM